MVLPWILAGFVAGDCLLQLSASLPSTSALLVAALAAGASGWASRRCGRAAACRGSTGVSHALAVKALAVLAAALTAWVYAGASARARLADALAPADEGRDLRLSGVIASLPTPVDGGLRFVVEVDAAADRIAAGDPGTAAPAAQPAPVPSRIALSWYAAPPVLPAQRWEWTVRLRRPRAAVNPAGFDAEAWMLEQDIRAQGSVRAGAHELAPRLIAPCVWRFNPLVDRARAGLRERLLQLLPGRRYASVLIALVIGDQSAISEQDWSLFNRTGISHLVSISGLHITMIAAATALLTAALWRRSPLLLRCANIATVRGVAGIAGGLAYCLLAGWGVPAQRTVIMLSVVALAHCARVRLSSPTTLGLAGFLVCLWDPWAVLAAGFWLSFGAVACIFLAAAGDARPGAGWRWAVRAAIRLQAAITVGQMPLTLAIFGQVSLVAPLANAVAIPLVSYLVAPLALCAAALAACLPPAVGLARALLLAADQVFAWLTAYLQWLTTPTWAALALPQPSLWALIVAALGCAWLLAPAGWPLRWLGLCGLLPIFVWPPEQPGEGELWVTALDVGQGMALVVETADHAIVFDTGPRYSPEADAGNRVVVPYLRQRGIRSLDVLIVSHADIDHAGGAAAVLHGLSVHSVWSSLDPGHRLLPDAAAARRCSAGQQLRLGTLELLAVSPPEALYAQAHASSNAHSCVILARQGSFGVLLTGDVPARQEQQLVAAARREGWNLHVNLLVAPHHGSHSSSSTSLITATQPRWVSIQAGYRNRFGHPHPAVLERYREHGVSVLRTDEEGAIQWRFGLAGTSVLRWRRDFPRYWRDRPDEAADPAGMAQTGQSRQPSAAGAAPDAAGAAD